MFTRETINFWIGAHDVQTEGKFYLAKDPLIYMKWHTDQPDNGNDTEQCLELRHEYNYRLNDADCGLLNRFVCEI